MNTNDSISDEFPDIRSYNRPPLLSDGQMRQQRMDAAQLRLDTQKRLDTEAQKRAETEEAFAQFAPEQDLQNHLVACVLWTLALAAFLFLGHYLFPAAWAWLLHLTHLKEQKWHKP